MDGYATSDAEWDSEIESDSDSELSHWLDQLNQYSKDEAPVAPPVKRISLTPKQVMDSFRCSVLEGGGGSSDIDLDAILGDLCELESQLFTAQSEINASIEKNASSDNATSSPAPAPAPAPAKAPAKAPVAPVVPAELPQNVQWDDALDDQLQHALSFLNDITSVPTFRGNPDKTRKTNNNNDLDTTKNQGQGQQGQSQSRSSFVQISPPSSAAVLQNKLCDSQGNRMETVNPSSSSSSLNPLDSILLRTENLSRELDDNNSHHQQTYSSSPGVTDETDSAFSDNTSLPSSGSHASVSTSVSGNSASGGSAGAASSSASSADNAEGEARRKAEKVRIALEKIKEANIKKLFVRVYASDNSSKSILVDEAMTVSQVVDILVAKNHVHPHLNWVVMEHLSELHMERMLEDHDCLVDNILLWPRETTNKLCFVQRSDKYDLFIRPESYLLSKQESTGERMEETQRKAVLKEFLGEPGDTPKVPDTEGYIYLKSEGKKAWKKFYFVLRASGLYYNPKAKTKSSKDLVCLQKLDFVDVFYGINWKKKHKAPTQYCFALKHPQIQKKTAKYIKYLCTEDLHSLNQWTAAIRLVRYGRQLYDNFDMMRTNMATWESRDVVPNPNFTDYLVRQHTLNEQYSGRQSYAGAELVRQNSMRLAAGQARNVKGGSVSGGSVSGDLTPQSPGPTMMTSASAPATPKKRASEMNREELQEDLIQSIVGQSTELAEKTKFRGETFTGGDEVRGASGGDSDSGRYSGDSSYTSDSLDGVQPQSSSQQTSSLPTSSSVPSKMLAALPLTTTTTRQISEQHGGTAAVRQATLRRAKRPSPTKGTASSLDLPPPPLQAADADLGVMGSIPRPESSCLPPPPSAELLQNLEQIGGTAVIKASPVLGASRNSRKTSLPNSPLQLNGSSHGSSGTPYNVPPPTAEKPILSPKILPANGSLSANSSPRRIPPNQRPPKPEFKPQLSGGSHNREDPGCNLDLSPSPQMTPGIQQGHRRTASGPNPLPVGSPLRQKPPPPPPKRNTMTKLSLGGEPATGVPFMADLNQALAAKQYGVEGGESRSMDGDDLPLPPPPAELLEGLPPSTPKKKPPPPPPKRIVKQ